MTIANPPTIVTVLGYNSTGYVQHHIVIDDISKLKKEQILKLWQNFILTQTMQPIRIGVLFPHQQLWQVISISPETPLAILDVADPKESPLIRIRENLDLMRQIASFCPKEIASCSKKFLKDPVIEKASSMQKVACIESRGLLEEKVIQATLQNKMGLLKMILDRKRVDSGREIAFIVASKENNLEMIDLIVSYGNISAVTRGIALCEATQVGNYQAVAKVLEMGTLSQDDLHLAFFIACTNQDLANISLIVDTGAISSWCLASGLVMAAKNCRELIVDRLLRTGTIEQPFFNQAVIQAAENGHDEVIKKLMTRGMIPESVRIEALTKAMESNHLLVIALLIE